MIIKTLAFNNTTKAMSRADETFVPDSATKASRISEAGLYMTGDTSCLQTIEAGQESSGGGAVRVMVKTVFRLPRLARSADPELAYVGSETEYDNIPIHIVVGIPKMVGIALASTAASYAPAKETYVHLIAKGVQDVVTTLLGHNATLVAPADVNVLISNLLASDAPLRRALARLQPLDTATGSYGTLLQG